MQLHWNLELLTLYSLFRILDCSGTNLLLIGFLRRSTPLEFLRIWLLIIQLSLDRIEDITGLLHKIKFCCIYHKIFFLIEPFLNDRGYELSKSTIHFISAPLTLKCVGILSWSIFFFYFSCLFGDVLCKTAIGADDNAFKSSCDKPSDLLQL